MHEINTAAETITAAADPDANIIFGATINPELEAEIIITVVATGFDETYFAKRAISGHEQPTAEAKTHRAPAHEETDVSSISMDLESRAQSEDESHDFRSDAVVPNIWSIDHDQDSHEEQQDHNSSPESEEAELEKPSFLRRLKKRRSQKDDDLTS